MKNLILRSWLLLNFKNRGKLFNLIFFNFFLVILELITLGILAQVLNVFTNKNVILELNYLLKIGDFFNSENYLVILFVLFFLSYLCKTLFLILFYHKQYSFTYNLKAELTSKVFRKYIKSPYIFHLNNDTSQLLRNIGNEVSLISTGIIHQLITIGAEFLIIISIIVFLLYKEPVIISLLTIFFIFFTLFYFFFISKKIKNLGYLRQLITTNIIKKTMNSLYGIKDIKILGKENFFHKKFEEATFKLSNLTTTISIYSQIPKNIIELVFIFIVCIVVIQIDNVNQVIPIVGLILFAGIRMMPSISKILVGFQNLKYNAPAMDVIFEILKSQEKEDIKENIIEELNFKKNITFKDVSFSYDDNNVVLKNLNITINQGEKIGIFGNSGQGKSTFIDLISTLITPTKGKILVDGVEINNKNSYKWRSKIGYVPQKVYIMDDKLKNNIALGEEEENINIEKVKEVIKKTNLLSLRSDENIEELLNFKISDRGLNLSGGEMQRIGLASSLYVESQILILDEATNSLDKNNEKILIENINTIFKDKTILFISHNSNIFKYCDKVYELKNGNLSKI